MLQRRPPCSLFILPFISFPPHSSPEPDRGNLSAPVPAGAAPTSREQRVTPTVRAVSAVAPAVVNITTTLHQRRAATPFDYFFGLPEREYQSESIGSGVIIDGKQALVLTNAHVVNGRERHQRAPARRPFL